MSSACGMGHGPPGQGLSQAPLPASPRHDEARLGHRLAECVGRFHSPGQQIGHLVTSIFQALLLLPHPLNSPLLSLPLPDPPPTPRFHLQPPHQHPTAMISSYRWLASTRLAQSVEGAAVVGWGERQPWEVTVDRLHQGLTCM